MEVCIYYCHCYQDNQFSHIENLSGNHSLYKYQGCIAGLLHDYDWKYFNGFDECHFILCYWNLSRTIFRFNNRLLCFCFLNYGIQNLVKTIYQELKNPTRDKQLVIIYGAGESGLITKRAIDRDANTRFKVTAFIDDDEAKEGKTVEGIRIFHTSELDQLLMANNIAHLIISIQNVAAEKKQIIIEKCLAHDVHILNVPPVTSWINGELSFKQIKKVKIEDLLERDPIRLDLDIIRKQLTDKTILITGGAGSIGSEIARQIIPFKPKSLIILDQAESPLYLSLIHI